MTKNFLDKIGWVAATMTVIMFSSYFDQIRLNLQGNPGSVILPATTILNSTSWLIYAVSKEKTDWPIFSCNFFGILVGAATLITAFI